MPEPQIDTQQQDEPVRLNRARLIASGLEFGGVILALAGLGWSIERYWSASRAEAPAAGQLLTTTILLIVSVLGGVLLWAAAEVVRRLEVLAESTREHRHDAPPSSRSSSFGDATVRSANAAHLDEQQKLLREMVNLLRDTRDIGLLTDAQRTARQELQAHHLAEQLEAQVPELLREHNWFEAFKRVQAARERFPSRDTWDRLENQIQAIRSQVEARDIEAATRQMEELAALGAWERAQDVMADLLARHPKAPGAIELARRVKGQRDQAETELRLRMRGQAQDYANRRDWPNALSTAKSLIQRFPTSPEAEALRLQLPTLQANAEVKLRQRMESEIRDLIAQRNFGEAVRVARDLLERYPHSPQASALQEQLPRLEEMASQHGQFV